MYTYIRVEELFLRQFSWIFFQPYLGRMWDLAEYFVAQLISETSMVSLPQYPTHRVLHKSTHYVHNSLHVRMHFVTHAFPLANAHSKCWLAYLLCACSWDITSEVNDF